jgi:hypothetical protein
MPTIEAELKSLMVAGLDGDAAAHRTLLDRLSWRLRGYYKVATADGKIRDFWERNLRFKTDVSDDGPHKGAPALVPAGMMGDRADVIFAAPEEISGFVTHQC